MLYIDDLYICLSDNTPVLSKITIHIENGQICALLGHNGSGKSTLASVLIGNPKYKVTNGGIIYNGNDLLAMSMNQRAINGIFLAFQHPINIPGVITINFLKTLINNMYLQLGIPSLSTPELLKLIHDTADVLKIDNSLLYRPFNDDFSGGEKKLLEILQMFILNPSLVILDELDSGMDKTTIDRVFKQIRNFIDKNKILIIITHNNLILDYLKPDIIYTLP